jgi:hypothetical protein
MHSYLLLNFLVHVWTAVDNWKSLIIQAWSPWIVICMFYKHAHKQLLFEFITLVSIAMEILRTSYSFYSLLPSRAIFPCGKSVAEFEVITRTCWIKFEFPWLWSILLEMYTYMLKYGTCPQIWISLQVWLYQNSHTCFTTYQNRELQNLLVQKISKFVPICGCGCFQTHMLAKFAYVFYQNLLFELVKSS